LTAHDKTSVGTGRGNWQTPPWLARLIVDRWALTYDAAASHENAIARVYSTTGGTFDAGVLVNPADGLAMPWEGGRVFFNPPYSDGLSACPQTVERLRCTECGGRLRKTWETRSNVDGYEFYWARHETREDCDNLMNGAPPQRETLECDRKRCEALGHPRTYTPGIADFVEKAASERERATVIVGVLPDARDTAWWRAWVKPHADDYPIGRVKFIDPDTGEAGGSPPGGTAIVVWTPGWLAGERMAA
jgi:hypothetical protein